jgi:predicted glycoside hydrolase/deacetylase ChbG (UPF0249 family)
MRALIVNADDFGLSAGVNEGVVRGHRDGIVTSTSLMVCQRAAAAAVEAAQRLPRLSVGLHVDLAEWERRGDDWVVLYQRADPSEQVSAGAEVARQLALFERMVGRPPTHLDSHQHVHREEPVRSLLREYAQRLDVPLRHESRVHYCGSFYGQGRGGISCPATIEPLALEGLIRALPDGVTEICCHPAAEVEPSWAYGQERLTELASLSDPTVIAAVRDAGVDLISFAEVRGS